jgi:tripartite-type tricarboxylate transporter receptor subunit TctC
MTKIIADRKPFLAFAPLSRLHGALIAGAIVALLAFLSGVARAETYPDRPVRLVIPFGPGGIADIHSRIIAGELSKRFGKQVYVENQPGGMGIPAARTALSAPPDGYTLTLFANGTATSVSLVKDLTFDPVGDFSPVANIVTFDFLIVVNSKSNYRSVSDVIRAAREHPGTLKIGTTASGSSSNLAALLFKLTANVDINVIPYRNPSDLTIGLLRNDVDMVLDTYALLKSTIDSGNARPIATTGPKRSTVLPDIPTVQEGGLPGFDVTSWNAIFVRKGVDKAIVQRLNNEVRSILETDNIKTRLRELGLEATPMTPEELGARLQSDIKKWAAVITKVGLAKK